MYKNSLASATYADDQATKCLSVGQSHKQMAEVTSLVVRLRNPPMNLHKVHISREMSEGEAHED